jgi:hypothetical protein
MSSVILTGDTSGTITVSAPLVAGSNTVTLPAATGTISLLQQGTAVSSTSGTSIDFTDIPSWAKRITVMFNGVSTSGTSSYLIRLGVDGVFATMEYTSAGTSVSNGNSTGAVSSTAGILTVISPSAAVSHSGQCIISLLDSSTNLWIGTFIGHSEATANNRFGSGKISLSGALNSIRITTVNGTDTFDAGTINVMWEG